MTSIENIELEVRDRLLDFNWNSETHPLSEVAKSHPSEPTPEQIQQLEIVDEGRRDGIQNVKVYPDDEASVRYIESVFGMGINRITVAMYPGKAEKVNNSTNFILKQMRDIVPDAIPIVLSITTPESLEWAARCKEINPKLEAIVFMGTAPSRLLVQGWDARWVIEQIGDSTRIASEQYDIPVIGATEHTTQTPPEYLKEIAKAQIENGAKSLCIADTIGWTRPRGIYRIVEFYKNITAEMGVPDMPIEYHGHRDLDQATVNAMTAIAGGATRIHVTPGGIGERAGNTPLEGVLLLSSQILEENGLSSKWNLRKLSTTLERYFQLVQIEQPTHGIMGTSQNETRSGLHVDAMLKAKQLAKEAVDRGDFEQAARLYKMANTIYSAIDPHTVGREHSFKISPLSGKSAVLSVAEEMGYSRSSISPQTIEKILQYANDQGRDLSEEELEELFSNSQMQF